MEASHVSWEAMAEIRMWKPPIRLLQAMATNHKSNYDYFKKRIENVAS